MPEIVPSTFEENLPKSEFTGEAVYEYPVQTGYKKVSKVFYRHARPLRIDTDVQPSPCYALNAMQALEVYQRLVVSQGAPPPPGSPSSKL